MADIFLAYKELAEPHLASESSAMSYGDDGPTIDYNWYFSLDTEDRAQWWADMEATGRSPYAEFTEMTREWYLANPTQERSDTLLEVSTMMLNMALENSNEVQ